MENLFHVSLAFKIIYLKGPAYWQAPSMFERGPERVAQVLQINNFERR